MANRTWANITFNLKQLEEANPEAHLTQSYLEAVFDGGEVGLDESLVVFSLSDTSDLYHTNFIANNFDGIHLDGLDYDFSWGSTGEIEAGEEFYRNGKEVSSPDASETTISLMGLLEAQKKGETIDDVIFKLEASQGVRLADVA